MPWPEGKGEVLACNSVGAMRRRWLKLLLPRQGPEAAGESAEPCNITHALIDYNL